MHGERHRGRPPAARSMHLFEVIIFTAFISIVAFCAYDGFKEIFTKPVPFKPKEAEDSIAELKASIAKTKDTIPHKYVQAARGEGRSALQSAEQRALPYTVEPVVQVEPEKAPQYTKVVVVSAMQEAPCLADGGNELHYQSVLNKQDYARLHGYDFVLGIKQVDPQLENMWNKPAWLLKVLEDEERQGEWVLWMDIDTVVIDANFTLPYEEFAAKSKDLVVYGNLTQVKAGHPLEALNTGVMLVRNSPWSRHFFAEVNRLGRLDDHHKGKTTLSSILLKELQADAYSDGLRDQNAVIYLLKTHPEWHDRVAFLDKEVCLNCYWRDLIGVTGFGKPDYDRKENVTFVQHFMGCQTCNALNRNGDLDSCRDAMFHSFRFVRQHQAPMLKAARPRSESDLAQLRELPYCSLNQEAEGCQGAQPLDSSRFVEPIPEYDWKAVDSATVASTRSGKTKDEPTVKVLSEADLSGDATRQQQSEGSLQREGRDPEPGKEMASKQAMDESQPSTRREARESTNQRRSRHRKRVHVTASRAASRAQSRA